MRKTLGFVTIFSCLTILMLVGCDKGGLKGLVPVEGDVFYNGAAVEGANVRFAPETKSETSRSAHATTDAAGHFVLMTLKPGDGAAPGKYKISIQKLSEPPRPDKDEDMGKSEGAQFSYMKDQVESLLPQKYAASASSGLEATVPAEGVKDLKFELTD